MRNINTSTTQEALNDKKKTTKEILKEENMPWKQHYGDCNCLSLKIDHRRW